MNPNPASGLELIQTLLQQATARGARSTALQPLAWALGLVLAAFVSCIVAHSPVWVTVLLGTLSSFLVLTYVAAYLFFMTKNPDALRSETFTLSKMQIERSKLGDSEHGFSTQLLKEHANIISIPGEGSGD